MKLGVKRVATAFSLASLALVVVVLNNHLIDNSTKGQATGRQIASLEKAPAAQLDWEYQLAAQLAEGTERIPASLRSRPSEFQQLIFGDLEGKYAQSFVDGKISELSFFDSTSGGDRPKYINDYEAFLLEHRGLLAKDYAAVKSQSQRQGDRGNIKTYDLLNEQFEAVGSAEFTTDPEGRLLKLRVTDL